MKKIKKLTGVLLVAVMLCATIVALTACGNEFKVTYQLSDGYNGTLPPTAAYTQFEEFTLPAITDSSVAHMEQIGWKDGENNFYANGDTFTMGGFDITLTAVFRGKQVVASYCENAGNFYMAGKGDLGPSPAYTTFYADKTWEAEAFGKAMFAKFSGTWDLTGNGVLSMKLVEQDGIIRNEDVVIDTSDARVFSWTLSHPSDRSGTSLKYHKNHLSKYALLKSYNAEFGATLTLPAEPVFNLNFKGNGTTAAPVTGEQAIISAKVGETVTMPAATFARADYTFSGWQVVAGENISLKAGEKYTMVSWDLTVNAQWTANA